MGNGERGFEIMDGHEIASKLLSYMYYMYPQRFTGAVKDEISEIIDEIYSGRYVE